MKSYWSNGNIQIECCFPKILWHDGLHQIWNMDINRKRDLIIQYKNKRQNGPVIEILYKK